MSEEYECQSPEQLKAEKRRMITLVSVLGAVIIAIGAAVFFWLSAPEDEADENANIEIGVEDATEIELIAFDIVSALGNFGVNGDMVDESNILFVANGMAREPSDFTDFLDTRSDAYRTADEFILEGSPADIDPRSVDNWSNSFETSSLATFTVTPAAIELDVDTDGTTYDVDGIDRTAVRVNGTFDSIQRNRLQSSFDSEWDGSYKIMEKTFAGNEISMTFVEDGESWKLYAIDNPDMEFLLANWENPQYGEYMDSQQGFEEVDTIISAEVTEFLKEME